MDIGGYLNLIELGSGPRIEVNHLDPLGVHDPLGDRVVSNDVTIESR